MVKTLIFDFDGTIADTIPSTEYMAIVLRRLSEEFGFDPLTEEEIDKFRSQDLHTILKVLQIPLWKVPFLLRKIQVELKKELNVAKPVAGMRQLLCDLQSKEITLGIITSSKKDLVDAFLKRNNLEVFDFVYTGTSLFGKDRMIIGLLRNKKLKPEEIMYVGDEIRDIEAAKKAHIKIVSVTWGFNSHLGLKKYHPDFLIDKPAEFMQLLPTMKV